MSEVIDPAAPLAFCAAILGASVFVVAEASLTLTEQSLKGLNAVRKEGVVVSSQMSNETLDFLYSGATMSTSLINDLRQGAVGELMHGVKEGGRIFSGLVGKSEVVFERCGTAIIGKLADENQELIDRDVSRRIAEAYQTILNQIGDISVGKDPLMIAHKEHMEAARQSLASIKAEEQAINQQLQAMEKERIESELSIKGLEETTDEVLKSTLLEANQSFERNVKELNQKIASKEQAIASLRQKNEEKLKEEHTLKLEMERLEKRQEQSKELIDVHRSRIKEHTSREIERIIAETGIENPSIELSEGENNIIRIHIEE